MKLHMLQCVTILLSLQFLFFSIGFSQDHYALPEIEPPQLQAETSPLIVLRNQAPIPIRGLDKNKIAVISLGGLPLAKFHAYIQLYTQADHFHLKTEATVDDMQKMWQSLNSYDIVIIGVAKCLEEKSNFARIKLWLEVLLAKQKAVCAIFDKEKKLTHWGKLEDAESLLFVDNDTPVQQAYAAQVIFGGLGTTSKVSITNPVFLPGSGVKLSGGERLGFVLPLQANDTKHPLTLEVDSIIREALTKQAFPGCQVLIGHKGKIVLQKAYGYHTFDNQRAVHLDHLYDLASVTKVTGPLPILMQMHGEGKLDLDQALATYWKDLRSSNKSKITLRQALAHNGRLQSYIVFWQNTLKKNGKFKQRTFSTNQDLKFNIAVSQDLYLHKNYNKKMFKAIRKSPLNADPGYVYSGLGFLIYPHMISEMQGQPFKDYLYSKFYRPLGAFRLGFNPYLTYNLAEIIPTEYDSLLRKRQVHGYVHDEAAAMFGGVSGNAGLFSNTNDLAKLLQMYLNKGKYGDQRFIASSSIEEFTAYQFTQDSIPRGLGFDKNRFHDRGTSYIYHGMSPSSFGHSGFTGTVVWMDPEHELLIIFLSNRVYPTRNNGKLVSLKVRAKVQELAFKHLIQNNISKNY